MWIFWLCKNLNSVHLCLMAGQAQTVPAWVRKCGCLSPCRFSCNVPFPTHIDNPQLPIPLPHLVPSILVSISSLVSSAGRPAAAAAATNKVIEKWDVNWLLNDGPQSRERERESKSERNVIIGGMTNKGYHQGILYFTEIQKHNIQRQHQETRNVFFSLIFSWCLEARTKLLPWIIYDW